MVSKRYGIHLGASTDFLYGPRAPFRAGCRLSIMGTDDKTIAFYKEAFGLTGAQARVLHLITHGKRNREIAVCLGISKRTVEKHVERILDTLGAENRTAAAAIALERLNNENR